MQLTAVTIYAVRCARFETTRSAESRVEWLETHCGPRARLGLMNAGKLAYLAGFRSELTFVNLDGVVNNALLEAYRSGTFADYYCTHLVFPLELPTPEVFREPRLRAAFEVFRRDVVVELSTRPQPLFRFRCARR